jgi:excisionase family DNA binding protein
MTKRSSLAKEKPVKNKTTKELLEEKGYIPASKAAEMVGKSLQTIYYWIDDKKIEAHRIDTHWYVLRQSLIDYYKKQDPAAVALLGLEDK